ncbi:uncharacterized protein [Aristolochia californica]|uniref:uncharacterized protein n=1 Tax=Aristolochia californica TaxID=171875 RepID=UPI0035DE3C69
MASVLPVCSSLLRPPSSSSSGRRKSDRSDAHRLRVSSSNWWTPLFGWASDPDYTNDHEEDAAAQKARNVPDKENAESQPRRRYAPGCFTQEKAKQLRLKTMETETFHDVMYHSSIASRLASDLSNRYGR